MGVVWLFQKVKSGNGIVIITFYVGTVQLGIIRLKTVFFVLMLFAFGVVGLAIRLASWQRNSNKRVC